MPLLRQRSAGQAYLCRQGRCELPVSTIDALRGQLAAVRLDVPS
jgi:uncharacterized protein YyaL (SSP411 family)